MVGFFLVLWGSVLLCFCLFGVLLVFGFVCLFVVVLLYFLATG